MRRSQGQVFVLAHDKVADSHTRGSHWRKMYEMQLMSMLRFKETIDGTFQTEAVFGYLVISFFFFTGFTARLYCPTALGLLPGPFNH